VDDLPKYPQPGASACCCDTDSVKQSIIKVQLQSNRVSASDRAWTADLPTSYNAVQFDRVFAAFHPLFGPRVVPLPQRRMTMALSI
jgi:hypothetical protein